MTPREIYLLVVQTKAIVCDIRFNRDIAAQLVAEAAQHLGIEQFDLAEAARQAQQFVNRNYDGSWTKH